MINYHDVSMLQEIGMISKMHDEFESRNMCVIVVCADSGEEMALHVFFSFVVALFFVYFLFFVTIMLFVI